jgi:carboxyl-terminal processing protease
MLHVLDPHSNFYDPKAFAQMREDQHGKYYGVGMSIQPQPDKNGVVHVVVLAPFEGTPGVQGGHQTGRRDVSIDGKPATAGLRRGSLDAQGAQGHARLRGDGARGQGPAADLRPGPRRDSPRYSVDLAVHDQAGHRLHPHHSTSWRPPAASWATHWTSSRQPTAICVAWSSTCAAIPAAC